MEVQKYKWDILATGLMFVPGGQLLWALRGARAASVLLRSSRVGRVAASAARGIRGTRITARRFPNVGGGGIDMRVNGYRVGGVHWHRFAIQKGGQVRNLPHYHRRPGIGWHRPWQKGW